MPKISRAPRPYYGSQSCISDLARVAAILIFLFSSAACNVIQPALSKNQNLVHGPPITDIVTPFDKALECLDGRVSKRITFSVGAILDQTGKEQYTNGGSGKYISQGAGDIVQSALFRSGATVINRRDPRIMDTEVRWGLIEKQNFIRSDFFVTGSINSLDFLPGGGLDLQVRGIGPRYRQHRILVGLDISLTEAKTGRIVANIPIQKQIVATETGLGVGRFFGDVLVNLDTGGGYREATQFAVRQMLNFATFELITQLMKPKNYIDCRQKIARIHGFNENSPSARAIYEHEARVNEERIAEENRAMTKLNQVALSSMLETSDENQETVKKAGTSSPNNDLSDTEMSSPGSSKKMLSNVEGPIKDREKQSTAFTDDKSNAAVYSNTENIERTLEKKNRIINQ